MNGEQVVGEIVSIILLISMALMLLTLFIALFWDTLFKIIKSGKIKEIEKRNTERIAREIYQRSDKILSMNEKKFILISIDEFSKIVEKGVQNEQRKSEGD